MALPTLWHFDLCDPLANETGPQAVDYTKSAELSLNAADPRRQRLKKCILSLALSMARTTPAWQCENNARVHAVELTCSAQGRHAKVILCSFQDETKLI